MDIHADYHTTMDRAVCVMSIQIGVAALMVGLSVVSFVARR